jgi:hypothetical protein
VIKGALMQKKVKDDTVYYAIGWSKTFKYDRISAARILPELPGILYLYEESKGRLKDLLCYACWRDGLRMGIKVLLDPIFSTQPQLLKQLKDKKLYFKYTIIDSSPQDMQDVMFWIMRSYAPVLNNSKEFTDSKRFREICVKEANLKKGEIDIKISNMR